MALVAIPHGVVNLSGDVFMSLSPIKQKCVDCPALTDDNCPVMSTTTLSSYKPGQKGTVCQVCGAPDFRLRMMEMGFVKGTEVKVVKYAPLYDPMQFELKGYHVSLRRDQADDIIMNIPEKAA
jgi:Fe2+ transport system protein FeoA